jgi:glycerol-3-phosphate dehydrogenase (NAD(P)+)
MTQYPHRATVVGTGGVGTLCALLLARNGLNVTLWGRSESHIADLERDRENRRHLPGFHFPDGVLATHNPDRAFHGAELLVSAVPCQFLRSVWTRLRDAVPESVPIVSMTKGIELGTRLRPTRIISELIAHAPVACLSGPCIAPEAAAGLPAGVVAAAEDPAFAQTIQRLFSSRTFRVYTSRDVIGVEIAGAVKNVVAIAAGICDGIRAGDNTKAALLTRGLVEITRLGVALGAAPDTFRGLAGVGDLFTTCVSKIGRNRTAGERIGRGEPPEHVIAATDSVIEGIPTTRAVLDLAAEHNLDMPIVSAVASILFDACPPRHAINRLMTRPLRGEFE